MDVEEFHSVMAQFGIDLPKEQLTDCFNHVDRDRSGFVSREELIYALRVQHFDKIRLYYGEFISTVA